MVEKKKKKKKKILSKCPICGSKKSKFIKNQEETGLLSNLGIRTSLSKVGDILFWIQFHWSATVLKYKKMNEMENQFLLAGDKSLY